MSCNNCEGENAKTGYVEDWDGVCPDCGRLLPFTKLVKPFGPYSGHVILAGDLIGKRVRIEVVENGTKD